MNTSLFVCFKHVFWLLLKNGRCLAFILILCLVILSSRVLFQQDSRSFPDRYKADKDTLTSALVRISEMKHKDIDKFVYPESTIKRENSLTGSPNCLLLQLDPFHHGIGKFMKDMGKLRCKKTYYSKLRHMQLLVEGKGVREASYKAILPPKNGDAGFEVGETKSLLFSEGKLDQGKEGNIQHSMGKCVHALGGYSHPPEGTKLCLYDLCDIQEERLIFQMAVNGIIKHKISSMCVAPLSYNKAKIREQTSLIFTQDCDEWASFKALDNGMVQHVKSKMCIHYQSGEPVPPNDVQLVLYPDCQSKDKHRFRWFYEIPANKSVRIMRDVTNEFLEISLQTPRTVIGNLDKEYVMQVSPNFDLKEPQLSEKRLNFLMLMLRSTSSAHFMRKMPMSLNFLESSGIDSIFFRGYSVVDESTRGQLAALLAGVSPREFADKSIDSLPWLFKIAKDHGYATVLTDDKPYSPMFKDALSGFKTKPAHHYTQPFWSAATRMQQPGSSSFCLGGQPKHNVTLNYLMDFFSIYKKLPKFAVAAFTELTSWNPNALSYADQDLFHFLKWMKIEGYLENTVLVLFSDHGSKHSNLRGSLQGKMEERMPLLSIALPPKAPKGILSSVDNLKASSKRLIHPFDVYETLKLLLLYHVKSESKVSKKNPENLLTQLNGDSRSCDQIKIPAHWCPCIKEYPLSTHNNKAKIFEDAGRKAVLFINKIISSESELSSSCSKLSYHSIKTERTVELKPREEVLKFRRSESATDCVDCIPKFEKHSTTKMDSFYTIFINVNPGMHLLRALVNVREKDIFIHPGLAIVDIESDRKCVSDNSVLKNSSSKRFCICR